MKNVQTQEADPPLGNGGVHLGVTPQSFAIVGVLATLDYNLCAIWPIISRDCRTI